MCYEGYSSFTVISVPQDLGVQMHLMFIRLCLLQTEIYQKPQQENNLVVFIISSKQMKSFCLELIS